MTCFVNSALKARLFTPPTALISDDWENINRRLEQLSEQYTTLFSFQGEGERDEEKELL